MAHEQLWFYDGALRWGTVWGGVVLFEGPGKACMYHGRRLRTRLGQPGAMELCVRSTEYVVVSAGYIKPRRAVPVWQSMDPG